MSDRGKETFRVSEEKAKQTLGVAMTTPPCSKLFSQTISFQVPLSRHPGFASLSARIKDIMP